MVNQFEATGGKFEGFRRSGAKGICATGEFIGSAEGRKISTASAFSGKPIPVVVRFSVGGANPKAADNAKTQRNLALQFNLPAGEIWQMGNISAPVFGSSTPEQLLGRLQSLQPDSTTKVADPVKVKGDTLLPKQFLLVMWQRITGGYTGLVSPTPKKKRYGVNGFLSRVVILSMQPLPFPRGAKKSRWGSLKLCQSPPMEVGLA